MRFIVLFFLLSIVAYASNINIKILDEDNNKPIPYIKVAAISLNNKTKDSLQFGMTNKTGAVVLKAEPPFKIEINATGYNKFTQIYNNSDDITIVLNLKSYQLDEIVTTGQYTPKSSQNSVYKVQSITFEKIQSQSAANLQELMAMEMNMKVNVDPTIGSSLSMNGLSGENVKILINGVPVIGRLNGNIDLSQINLNNAEKIEIIDASMSTIYGNNAAGGIINIISKDYFDQKILLNANSYYESVGTYNFDGGIGYNFGKYNIMISGGRNFFKGYSIIDTSRSKLWKPKEQYFSDWQFNAFRNKISFKYYGKYFYDYLLNRGDLQKPYYETAFDDTYKTFRLSNTLSLKGEIAKGRFFDLIADYSIYERRKNTYFNNLVNLKKVLTSDPEDQDTSKFNTWMFRGTYSHDNAWDVFNYQVGFDINLDEGTGDKIKDNQANIQDYAGFLSLQYNISKNFIIQPAFRYIYNSKYDAPLSPSINIKYDFDENYTLRASYNKGFRAPTLKELYLFFVDVNHNIKGNPDLDAEIFQNVKLDFDYRVENPTNVWKVQNSLFYNYISDKIYLIMVDPLKMLYTNINIGLYRVIGYNINLHYIRESINSKFGAAILAASPQDQNPDYKISYELTSNILWSSPYWDLQFALFYKFFGKQNSYIIIDENNFREYYIDPYHLFDLTISKEFFDKQVNLSFGIKNIFDVRMVNTATATGGVHTGGDVGGHSPVSYGRIWTTTLRFNLK